MNRRNRDNLTCLDLVKEQDGDLADLLRGDSALLDAAKRGNLDRVKKLLTPGNINCRDKQGRNSTPLHLAGEGGVGLTVDIGPGARDKECHLAGDEINLQSTRVSTEGSDSINVWLLAAGYNHLDVVEYLLEEGADVNAKDKGGLIPLHNASSFGVS